MIEGIRCSLIKNLSHLTWCAERDNYLESVKKHLRILSPKSKTFQTPKGIVSCYILICKVIQYSQPMTVTCIWSMAAIQIWLPEVLLTRHMPKLNDTTTIQSQMATGLLY